MFIPGVVVFASLCVCALSASARWFLRAEPRLPEWRWLSLLLAAAFGAFALSFARPLPTARSIAEGILALVAAAELVIAWRRDRGPG